MSEYFRKLEESDSDDESIDPRINILDDGEEDLNPEEYLKKQIAAALQNYGDFEIIEIKIESVTNNKKNKKNKNDNMHLELALDEPQQEIQLNEDSFRFLDLLYAENILNTDINVSDPLSILNSNLSQLYNSILNQKQILTRQSFKKFFSKKKKIEFSPDRVFSLMDSLKTNHVKWEDFLNYMICLIYADQQC